MPRVIMSIFPTAMAMALALIQPAVHAAGECKVLDKTSCSDDPICIWVSSHRMKTGETIEGYCRVKPGMKVPGDTTKSQGVKRPKADIERTDVPAKRSWIEERNITIGKENEYEPEHHSGHEMEYHGGYERKREREEEYEREHERED